MDDLWDELLDSGQQEPDEWQQDRNGQPEYAVREVQEESSEDIDPEEVLHRVEATILTFLEELFVHGRVPDISLGTVATTTGMRERRRAFMERQAQGAPAYGRVFPVLQIVHELVFLGKTASQRDVFYRLKALETFESPEQVNTAIQDVSLMLSVPRHALGISCASRGVVFGGLLIQEAPQGPWLDCSLVARSIPGDRRTINAFSFQSQATCLLVIEKDAIFQRLLDDGFAAETSSILITAKGVPDMATRAFLHAVMAALPHLRPMAVVDWNPSGMLIYSIYKHGSRARQGSAQHALPGLQLLAVRADMLQGVPDHVLQGPLTARDRALIASLKAGPLAAEPDAVRELDTMERVDGKAEVEALYEVSGMGRFSQLLAEDVQQLAAM